MTLFVRTMKKKIISSGDAEFTSATHRYTSWHLAAENTRQHAVSNNRKVSGGEVRGARGLTSSIVRSSLLCFHPHSMILGTGKRKGNGMNSSRENES